MKLVLPMDLCNTEIIKKQHNLRSGPSKNIVSVNKTMTEVDVISGFNIDDLSTNDEPTITIETNFERPVISLDNDTNVVEDIGVVMAEDPIQKNNTPSFKVEKNVKKERQIKQCDHLHPF